MCGFIYVNCTLIKLLKRKKTHFTKEDIQKSMGNKHLTWKVQSKTMRYQDIPIIQNSIQNQYPEQQYHQILARMGSHRSSHSFLIRMQNGSASLQDKFSSILHS